MLPGFSAISLIFVMVPVFGAVGRPPTSANVVGTRVHGSTPESVGSESAHVALFAFDGCVLLVSFAPNFTVAADAVETPITPIATRLARAAAMAGRRLVLMVRLLSSSPGRPYVAATPWVKATGSGPHQRERAR